MFSEIRDATAAMAFFAPAIQSNGWPDRVVIDKSGANDAGLQYMNVLLVLHGWFWLIEMLQVKYLNNIIEQDHRFIKRITRQKKGFKSFAAAQAALAGIETAPMIRKGQISGTGRTAFEQFVNLAALLCPAAYPPSHQWKVCDRTQHLAPDTRQFGFPIRSNVFAQIFVSCDPLDHLRITL